jgi:disulfide oxidoreductase YuzD
LHKDKNSFEAFVLWHYVDVKKAPAEEAKKQLIERIEKMLPLMPFTTKQLNDIITRFSQLA